MPQCRGLKLYGRHRFNDANYCIDCGMKWVNPSPLPRPKPQGPQAIDETPTVSPSRPSASPRPDYSDRPAFGYIQTYSGRRFYPIEPRAADLWTADIIHALSNICRFTGHTSGFYSVAQHSVLVSYAVPSEDALWGLLHDAPEAYVCDVARPVKPYLRGYKAIEDSIMACVCEKYGLPLEPPPSVKIADVRLLHTERRDLMKWSPDVWKERGDVEPLNDTILPMDPWSARAAFRNRLGELLPWTRTEA